MTRPKNRGGEVGTETPDDVLAKPVAALGELSVRARQFLERHGLVIIGHVADMSPKKMLADKLCGVTTVLEIRHALQKLDHCLDLSKDDESNPDVV